MGEHAERQAVQDYFLGSRSSYTTEPVWEKIACPICGKLCGGKGAWRGEGVHAHMKFKHGVKKLWRRKFMLGVKECP